MFEQYEFDKNEENAFKLMWMVTNGLFVEVIFLSFLKNYPIGLIQWGGVSYSRNTVFKSFDRTFFNINCIIRNNFIKLCSKSNTILSIEVANVLTSRSLYRIDTILAQRMLRF